MQSYDYTLIALLCLAALIVLLRPGRRLPWLAAALLIVAEGVQLLWIGPLWQLTGAYLGLTLLLAAALPAVSERRRLAQTVAAGAIVLCLAAAVCCWTLPLFELPAPTGTYAVGTITQVNQDVSRPALAGQPAGAQGRPIVYQIWYPAEPGTPGVRAPYTLPAETKPLFHYLARIRSNSLVSVPPARNGRPFPVLIFGHMWGGSRVQDTFLAEDLASHGYIVVSVDHPGNAARVAVLGGVVLGTQLDGVNSNFHTAAQIRATWTAELAAWVADDRFVLDRLAEMNECPPGHDAWFCKRMDFTRVGAFGHSFGGAASIALLGTDPRVKAAINIDGWTFDAIDHRTTQPVLFVYEGSALPRKPGIGADGELDDQDNAAVDASLARYGGLRAYVAGTLHLDFTDRTLLSPIQRLTYTGPIKGERIRTITRGLVLGFFDQILKGQGALPAYPEVTMDANRLK